MNSLAEAAAATLAASGEPWLPGLAPALARSSPGWTSFDQGRSYGTVRWLGGDSAGPRELVGEAAIGTASLLVEVLPGTLAERYRRIGIAEVVRPQDLELVQEAAALVGEVSDLASSMGHLVRILHVLRADDGYDVSHSEPTIPFSIFASVPGPCEKDRAIRLAESIIHEAMHLQLTLVEGVLPLVATDGQGHSPWQGRVRPVTGLLHGLYVFCVIVRFMDLVAAVRPDLVGVARRRRREIEGEVAGLGDFSGHLTEAGAALRDMCLRVVLFGPGA